MTNTISVHALHKKYGSFEAVKGIDYDPDRQKGERLNRAELRGQQQKKGDEQAEAPVPHY